MHAAVTAELADSELLIADGHHRYETARTYAEEIGGDGEHRFTLMALVSLDDPGLTVFGYHRLLTGLRGTDKPETLAATLREHFEIEEVPLDGSIPPARRGSGSSGTSTPICGAASACVSRTRPPSTPPCPTAPSPTGGSTPRFWRRSCCAAASA